MQPHYWLAVELLRRLRMGLLRFVLYQEIILTRGAYEDNFAKRNSEEGY